MVHDDLQFPLKNNFKNLSLAPPATLHSKEIPHLDTYELMHVGHMDGEGSTIWTCSWACLTLHALHRKRPTCFYVLLAPLYILW